MIERKEYDVGSSGIRGSLVDRILDSRGMSKDDLASVPMHDPYLLDDIEPAVDRIIQAVQKHEKIMIAGDYDTDGVTSTSIMIRGLRNLGGNVGFMIPHRFKDGYGLNMHMADVLSSADLVVTVDNGVAALDEIDKLSKSADVVITDHHQVKDRLPNAVAVIDPHRHDSHYPFPDICGAMVAYKVMTAVYQKLGKEEPKDLLPFAAIGTIGDVMPLRDENRTVVIEGMKRMKTSKYAVFRAMKARAETVPHAPNIMKLTSTDIGFQISPMFNALSRMTGDASRGVELLTTDDPARAIKILEEMSELNEERKKTEKQVTREAEIYNALHQDFSGNEPVVAVGNWPKGIIGITASRLVEDFSRPAFVITTDGNTGSARTAGTANIMNILDRCKEALVRYGGHVGAAGFTVTSPDEFRRVMHENCHALDVEYPKERIDLVLRPSEISLKSVEAVESLEPFGEGNREPLFMCRNLTVKEIKRIGKNPDNPLAHMSVTFDDGHGRKIKGVCFNGGDYTEIIRPGMKVSPVFHLQRNEWTARDGSVIKTPQLNIASIDFTPEYEVSHEVPGPDQFADLYRELNAMFDKESVFTTSPDYLQALVTERAGHSFPPVEKMLKALDQAGHLTCVQNQKRILLARPTEKKKTRISQTEAYKELVSEKEKMPEKQ